MSATARRRVPKDEGFMPQKDNLFGWCATGHHDRCRVTVYCAAPRDMTPTNCICQCHQAPAPKSKRRKAS